MRQRTRRSRSHSRRHSQSAAERSGRDADKEQAAAPQQEAPKTPAYEAPTQESVRQQIADAQAKQQAADREKNQSETGRNFLRPFLFPVYGSISRFYRSYWGIELASRSGSMYNRSIVWSSVHSGRLAACAS